MTESTKQHSKLIEILRWIGFLPGALIAGYLAFVVFTLTNQWTLLMTGMDLDSFYSQLYSEFTSHAAMGAGFVYAGAFIAPDHKKIVAAIFSGIGILAAGFLLFPALFAKNHWAIWGCLSMALGSGFIAYLAYTGQTDLFDQEEDL